MPDLKCDRFPDEYNHWEAIALWSSRPNHLSEPLGTQQKLENVNGVITEKTQFLIPANFKYQNLHGFIQKSNKDSVFVTQLTILSAK
jgi:hypothetical protein